MFDGSKVMVQNLLNRKARKERKGNLHENDPKKSS
jgi:hypothetical protein